MSVIGGASLDLRKAPFTTQQAALLSMQVTCELGKKAWDPGMGTG